MLFFPHPVLSLRDFRKHNSAVAPRRRSCGGMIAKLKILVFLLTLVLSLVKLVTKFSLANNYNLLEVRAGLVIR